MKEKFLELLAEHKEIYFLDLLEMMPEIKGEYNIYMPVKEGFNPNILWLGGVKQDFIKVFNDLWIVEKKIDWVPQEMFILLADGKPMYRLPLASKKSFRTKKECWMPINIKLNDTKRESPGNNRGI